MNLVFYYYEVFISSETFCLKVYLRRWDKMMELEESGFASSHGHTKITTMYREIISENDLKTSRKKFFTTKDKKEKPH